MEISNTNHFGLTLRHMQILAIQINNSLKANGVNNEALIRKLIEDILFSVGTEWDDYYYRDKHIDNECWFPTICFRDKVDINESTKLIIPDGNDSFHATMPFTAVESLFENVNDECKLDFEYGNSIDVGIAIESMQ